jgi:hypothetical protein
VLGERQVAAPHLLITPTPLTHVNEDVPITLLAIRMPSSGRLDDCHRLNVGRRRTPEADATFAAAKDL